MVPGSGEFPCQTDGQRKVADTRALRKAVSCIGWLAVTDSGVTPGFEF